MQAQNVLEFQVAMGVLLGSEKIEDNEFTFKFSLSFSNSKILLVIENNA